MAIGGGYGLLADCLIEPLVYRLIAEVLGGIVIGISSVVITFSWWYR